VDHSLGTAALQEGKPNPLRWAVVMAGVLGSLALNVERTALSTKPDAFQGNLAQCSAMKHKQHGNNFQTHSHSFP